MKRQVFKNILERLLVLDLSILLAFGLYNKEFVKHTFIIALILFSFIGLLSLNRFCTAKLKEWISKNIPVLTFITIALLSTLISQNQEASWEVFGQRYIPYFVLYFMGRYLGRKRKYLNFFITALAAGAVFVSIGSIWDIIKAGHFIRIFTSYKIKCLFPAYFLYTLPFFIGLIIEHKKNIGKIVALSSGGLIVFVVFCFHYYRGDWIALLTALFISSLLLKEFRKKGVILIVVIMCFILLVPVFRRRIISSKTLSPSLWGDRVPMWEASFKIFQRFPLLGSGPGTYKYFMYKVIDEKSYKEGKIHEHAHNTYLEILAEMGILGLLAFVSIFIHFFRHYLRKLPHNNPYYFPFLIMISAVLIGDLVESNMSAGVVNASMFWFLFGLAHLE